MDYDIIEKSKMYVDVAYGDMTPELEALANFLVSEYDAPTRGIPGGLRRYVEQQEKMTQEQFNLILSQPCKIEKCQAWIIQPQTILDNLVAVDLPDSKYFDSEDVEQRRTYSEYCSNIRMSADNTQCLMFCGHVKYGTNCGYGINDAEIRAWHSVFGGLICVQDHDELLLTTEWQQPEETE